MYTQPQFGAYALMLALPNCDDLDYFSVYFIVDHQAIFNKSSWLIHLKEAPNNPNYNFVDREWNKIGTQTRVNNFRCYVQNHEETFQTSHTFTWANFKMFCPHRKQKQRCLVNASSIYIRDALRMFRCLLLSVCVITNIAYFI